MRFSCSMGAIQRRFSRRTPDDPSPASVSAAASAGSDVSVAPHASPTPASAPGTASAAQPPAAGELPAAQASAPDITASIAPQAQDKQHRSSAPSALDSGRRIAALAPDQIGALLRGKRVDDGSHMVRAAQVALVKLGYPVKPNGAEDAALSWRALRHLSAPTGWPRRPKSTPSSSSNSRRVARPGG